MRRLYAEVLGVFYHFYRRRGSSDAEYSAVLAMAALQSASVAVVLGVLEAMRIAPIAPIENRWAVIIFTGFALVANTAHYRAGLAGPLIRSVADEDCRLGRAFLWVLGGAASVAIISAWVFL